MDLVLHEHILTPRSIIFSMGQTTKTWEQLQLTQQPSQRHNLWETISTTDNEICTISNQSHHLNSCRTI